MKRIILASMLFLMALSLVSCGEQVKKGESKRIVIHETYKITAAEGETTHLTVLLPQSYGYQTIGDIAIKGADSHEVVQKSGHSVLEAKISGDGTEKKVELSFSVELTKGNLSWKGETIPEDTLPGSLIQSEEALIKDTAKSLSVEGKAIDKARKISDFVSSTLQFDYATKINVEPPTVVETLTSRKGVCADYANLMTALLRASGIPSRSISGLVFKDLQKEMDWSHQGGSHAWVEFYADGRWHFADPTWGNRYFDATDGYHLSYGDADKEATLYEQLLESYKQSDNTIIGAMSAPLKFICASSDKNASVTPSGKVIREE